MHPTYIYSDNSRVPSLIPAQYVLSGPGVRGVCLPVVQHPVSFNIYKAAAKQSSSQKSGSDLGRGGSAPFEYNIMKTMDLLVTRLCDAVIHQYQEEWIYTVKISCAEISERVDLMVYCKQSQTNCAQSTYFTLDTNIIRSWSLSPTSTSNPFLCAADFFLQLGSCKAAVR